VATSNFAGMLSNQVDTVIIKVRGSNYKLMHDNICCSQAANYFYSKVSVPEICMRPLNIFGQSVFHSTTALVSFHLP